MSKRNIDRIMTEARQARQKRERQAAEAATRNDPAAEGERAAREDNRKACSEMNEAAMNRPRTKQVPGYRIQPKLPISIGLFGGICEEADFTVYADTGPCVEASIRLGLIKGAYTLVLTFAQALEADIIEKV